MDAVHIVSFMAKLREFPKGNSQYYKGAASNLPKFDLESLLPLSEQV